MLDSQVRPWLDSQVHVGHVGLVLGSVWRSLSAKEMSIFTCVGLTLDSCWTHVGLALDCVWPIFGTAFVWIPQFMLDSCWIHAGQMLGSVDCFLVPELSILTHVGLMLDSCWTHVGLALDCVWPIFSTVFGAALGYHVGLMLDSFHAGAWFFVQKLCDGSKQPV